MVENLRPGMKGGNKQMWLRQNKDLVIRYTEVFGPDDACQKFNMKRVTLERLYKAEKKDMPYTAADRALDLAKMCSANVRELRGQVFELKTDFGQFQENVVDQIGSKILKPWIQAAIQITEEMEVKKVKAPTSLSDVKKLEDGKNENQL